MTDVARNLQQVRERIAQAAGRVGRKADDVFLICVSKTRSITDINEAIAAGATDLGENYVQELVGKQGELGDRVKWHLIGHLQTNKAKYVVPFCDLIHSVDSIRLAHEIGRRASQYERRQSVLIEVNCAGEASKFGIVPDQALELAQTIQELPAVELQGLMTMAPMDSNPEGSRWHYRRLARLREELLSAGIPTASLRTLSMGMTQDFEVAIEEGATMVRVGTAIFGPRHA